MAEVDRYGTAGATGTHRRASSPPSPTPMKTSDSATSTHGSGRQQHGTGDAGVAPPPCWRPAPRGGPGRRPRAAWRPRHVVGVGDQNRRAHPAGLEAAKLLGLVRARPDLDGGAAFGVGIAQRAVQDDLEVDATVLAERLVPEAGPLHEQSLVLADGRRDGGDLVVLVGEVGEVGADVGAAFDERAEQGADVRLVLAAAVLLPFLPPWPRTSRAPE